MRGHTGLAQIGDEPGHVKPLVRPSVSPNPMLMSCSPCAKLGKTVSARKCASGTRPNWSSDGARWADHVNQRLAAFPPCPADRSAGAGHPGLTLCPGRSETGLIGPFAPKKRIAPPHPFDGLTIGAATVVSIITIQSPNTCSLLPKSEGNHPQVVMQAKSPPIF